LLLYFKEENVNRSFQPLGDRVVVKPIEKEEVTSSGLVLPDTAKEKPQEGEIIAVGKGRVTDDGKTINLEVKVGDIVVYSKYAGTEYKEEGEDYLILRESDILAKVG
jgi:chaperonin GroES